MSLRSDEQAASEIVGAMVLIVVVLAAATSFATFALEKQEEIQRQEQFQFRKDSEEFVFLAVDTTTRDHDADPATPDRIDELRFTVQALHGNPFDVQDVVVNDLVLREFDLTTELGGVEHVRVVEDVETYPYTDGEEALQEGVHLVGDDADGDRFPDRMLVERGHELDARQRFIITVNLRPDADGPYWERHCDFLADGDEGNDHADPCDTEDHDHGGPTGPDAHYYKLSAGTITGQQAGFDYIADRGSADFYQDTPDLFADRPMEFGFVTGYHNRVTHQVVPPTAIAAVDVDCTLGAERFILDAQDSRLTDGDRYLVDWAWSGTYDQDDDGNAEGPITPGTGVTHDLNFLDATYDDGNGATTTTFEVTLTVRDSAGMVGATTLNLTTPSC